MARDQIGADPESLDCVDIAREILEEAARIADDWERERAVAAIIKRARREAFDQGQEFGAAETADAQADAEPALEYAVSA